MRRTFAGAIAIAGSIAVSLLAQQPTFKTNTSAVLLDVRVIDHDGQFVADLGKGDFKIQEDGVEQTVETFSLVNIPITAPTPPPMFAGKTFDSDVASNERSDGRLYVMVLDDLNMHPLRTPTARAIAREFIEHHVTPEDRVLLTTTSGRKDLTGEFTNDRQLLLSAADRFEAGYGIDRREPASHSGHNALMALSGIAKWLSVVDGKRKTIIFVSEGFDGAAPDSWAQWAPGDVFSDFLESLPGTASQRASDDGSDLSEIAQTAARSNVTIFGIDPIGQPGAPAAGVKPTPWLNDDDITSASGWDRVTASRDALAALSEATGGFAAVRTNDFSGAFDRVVEESSSYYLLGYTPTNPKRDGKFRKLSVHTTRPGLGVQARSGYNAQSDKVPKASAVPKGWTPDLVNAIQSPVQVSGLTMNVTAVAFRGTGGDAAVEAVVETRSDAVHFTADANRSQGSVGLALVVADADGHVKASHHGDLDMQLQPGTRGAVDQYGVRLLTRLKLKPGHYTMRVASVDTVGVTKGSVLYPLEIPDFSKGQIAMSGLALATRAESQRPTTGADKDWKTRFESPPTAARRFKQDDELTAFGEIYNNAKPGEPIEVTTSVRNEADQTVFRQQDVVSGAASYPRRATIPLKDFKPGNYLLTLEARSRTQVKSVASRQVLFSVLP